MLASTLEGKETSITQTKEPQFTISNQRFQITKEQGIGYRGEVLAVVNGNNKRKVVENRKHLVKAYVASYIGVGAGRRVGALVHSLVS